MIRVRSLRDGEMVVREDEEALKDALATEQPDWISAIAPTESEVEALCSSMNLHPLAMRDAMNEKQQPKLDDYGDYLFFVVHTPVKEAYTQSRKISVFLSKRWIVTVQTTKSDAMNEIAKRVEAAPERLLNSPDAVAHVVIDHMTGGFEGLTTEVLEDMTALEDRILGDPSPASMEAILKMRRRVIGLARVTRSQRDVCASLCRSAHESVTAEVMPYMRDVYDHVLRVHELLESARDGLAVTRDAYLSVVNNRLSEIMRTLTIIATVMMPLSLMAGIYGMNFEWMPFLQSAWGFWSMMALMFGIATYMLWSFRRKGWF